MYSGLTKSPVDKIPHDDSLSPIVNVLSKSVTTWIELSPQYLILLVILSLQIIINTSNIIIISYHEKIGHKKNDIINEKQFNGEKNNYFTDIIKTKDDNIAISGYTDSKISDKENAKPGETVTIKVDLEEGYKVDTIKVIDENGNEIVIGVNNTFIMPNFNVKIIVEASKIIDQIKNPETTDFITIFFALFIISCLSFLLYIKKKEN